VADPRAETRKPAKPARRRVAALIVLWTVVMVALASASGCYGHNCDGDVQTFGHDPGQGELLSADLWESSPIDGVWLDFPRARLWIFDLHDLGDRTPQVIIPYVSAQANPNNEPGGNFTSAAGNLAEISGVANNQVVIHNGTCADYFLRLTVQAAPRASTPSATDTDGGTDGAIP
jgi:hypothetical protein